MKIVHLETGRHFYGGARQVASLVNALTDYDNVLVCRPGAEIAAFVAPHVRVVETPLHGDLDVRAKARLMRLLAAEQPDVVHVHSRAGADHFGGRAARSMGMPAVLTRRVDSPEPRLWARHKFRSYAAIAAISTPIADWLCEDVGVPRERVLRIASGVDVAACAGRAAARAELEARFGIDPGVPVIAAAGQLIERKGHDVLIDALPEVLARRRDLRVIVFGRGPRAAALAARARRVGVAANVLFAGFVPQLETLLAGFDVFVHPARSEGLGLVVLEALAAAVPVIASRAGGLVDAVDDERTGLLVPPDDAPALAGALLRVLENEAFGRRLAAAARERVTECFSVQAMTDAYRRLYSGFTARAAAGAGMPRSSR